MRTLFTLLVSVILAGCALVPDSFNLTVRSANRVSIQGVNFGVTYNNPFKPRQVHPVEDFIFVRGGHDGGDMP